MANFNTHLVAGTVVSGLTATSFLACELVTPVQTVMFWVTGSLFSVFPDIDSDHSKASEVLFTLFGFVASFAVLIAFPQLPLIKLWLSVSAAFLFVRFIIKFLFQKYTVHRGIWHSLLAALFSSSIVVVICFTVAGFNVQVAYLTGIQAFTGYLAHLVLDELYAVDFSGAELKRSFGSALKPTTTKNVLASLFMVCTITVIGLNLPVPDFILKGISTVWKTAATYWQIIPLS